MISHAIVASLSVIVLMQEKRADLPTVELSYADLFDVSCSQQTKYNINSSWVSEIQQRMPEFRSAWEDRGPALLQTTQDVVGEPFVQREFLVSMSVCSLPSVSDPLLINMRFSLKAFTSDALPMDVSVSTIFHEILHRYLAGRIPENSKLLSKYTSEDETVRFHLHLFALQKAVYLKLGLAETLDRVIKKDQSLPNKSYGRAWQIVNDLEGYSVFVAELR